MVYSFTLPSLQKVQNLCQGKVGTGRPPARVKVLYQGVANAAGHRNIAA
jgi:hypothetical protein